MASATGSVAPSTTHKNFKAIDRVFSATSGLKGLKLPPLQRMVSFEALGFGAMGRIAVPKRSQSITSVISTS